MPGPVAVQIVLSADEREQLESWTRRRTSAQALALRSRIVLAAADGVTNSEIAERLGISRPTVTKWRSRFATERLDGLVDEPRPGRPRTVTDEHVDEVIVKTLESTPKDATHWSTRSMAAEVGLTQSAVHRIWRAFGLQPHRQDTWKLSKDPQFVAKVRDVVGLYLDPPERAVVLCVDEKSQIQALDQTAPILPMLPGVPERATHDSKRHGTSSLYAALDITTGKVIGSLHARHRAIEFKKFLQTIDREVPAGLDVHLILDNASTHKTPAIKNWLTAHPRFVVHFTPTSSSWLNLVERWFGELTTKKLRRATHRSVRQLNTEIRAWIDTWNDNPRPFVWTPRPPTRSSNRSPPTATESTNHDTRRLLKKWWLSGLRRVCRSVIEVAEVQVLVGGLGVGGSHRAC
jgi:transposase